MPPSDRARRSPLVQWMATTLFLLMPLAAHAQVYKCTEGPAVIFSDKPCASAAAVSTQIAVTSNADGRLDFQADLTRHYLVTGPNFRAARLSMNVRGPGGWSGMARWKVDYTFESKRAGQGCAIGRVAVRVVGDIQMPQWVEEASASQADQFEWRRLYANLERHEQGHIQHGREFGLLLKERLLGIGTVPCDELKGRAQQVYTTLYANLNQRDAEYDRRTDHGLRQDNPS